MVTEGDSIYVIQAGTDFNAYLISAHVTQDGALGAAEAFARAEQYLKDGQPCEWGNPDDEVAGQWGMNDGALVMVDYQGGERLVWVEPITLEG